MLTSDEKNIILSSLANIQLCIGQLTKTRNLFSLKKTELYNLFKINHEASNVYSSLDDFLELEADLKSLDNFFHKEFNLDSNITNQYKTFLQTELVRFNPSQLTYLDDQTFDTLSDFLCKQQPNQPYITPNDNYTLNMLRFIPSKFTEYISNLLDLQCKFYIFNKIKNISGSIVMVGANGSGKSTFARQLKGKLSDNVIILSAQHFLYYTKSDFISTTNDEVSQVRQFQYDNKLATEDNFQQLLTSDMNNLIKALISQHTNCALSYYDSDCKKQSFLLKTIELWEKIIEHRKIKINGSNLLVYNDSIPEYDFNNLSDGEKAVFYYIAHIILAPKNSYIIVDEPENHLHASICDKLWNALELNRNDCKFVYLTHDLNFATTRNNSTILWNKSFTPPFNWEFDVLPQNDIIPEVLVMELVGSRKNICFCEGITKGSIDYKLYTLLFPNYTIIPVSGHRNVIDYVIAYNSTPSFTTTAVGIIDGDHHLPEQISAWHENKIYSLPINEVENILCDEHLLEEASNVFCAGENSLHNYFDKFWDTLSREKEQQATQYVNECINNTFCDNFLHEKRDVNNLIEELQTITSSEKILNLHKETCNKIDSFIQNKDYDSALRFVNFKKRLTNQFASQNIVNKYEDRILNLISKDDALQKYILNKYFNDFFL